MPKFALGIDMGGTGIKLAFVDKFGKLFKTLRLSTPAKTDPEKVASLIAEKSQWLLRDVQRKGIVGIGIGCAGDVDPVKGVIRVSPNLRWKNVPLKKLLERRL